MTIDQLKEIIEMFNHSNMTTMDLEFENIKIKLEKEKELVSSPIINKAPSYIEEMKEVVQIDQQKEEVPEGTMVKSPIVGIYYDQRSPESPSFVEEGMMVEKGQILCIVEAMKVMNEIVAPCSGKLLKKLAANEDFVEFEQNLMIIQE